MAYTPHDKFAELARQQGYRARSVFKLLDLQKKFHVLRKGDVVLDLGAAPGSWMQATSRIVGARGSVVGIDVIPIEPLRLANSRVFQKSITDEDVVDFLAEHDYQEFDVVLSDVAPNTTGIQDRDQAVSYELSVRALQLAVHLLKARGNLVIKVFEGPSTPELVKEAKKHFARVHLVKPESSTKGSKELFLVANGFVADGQKGGKSLELKGK